MDNDARPVAAGAAPSPARRGRWWRWVSPVVLLLAAGAGATLLWQREHAQQAARAARSEDLLRLAQAQQAAHAASPPAATLPAVPAATLPAVPAATLPAVPAATLPAVPAATLPAVPAAMLPAVPAATLPAVPAAMLPAVPDPALTALATHLASLDARLDAVTRTLDAQPQSVPLAFDTLALAEATALVALAEQRLLLARDVAGAAAALGLAQARIAVQAPRAAGALAADMARLAAFQDADLAGVAAELAVFARVSAQWPLAGGTLAPVASVPAATPTARGVLLAMWGDLRQLVEIRPAGPALDPLLDPLGAALLRRQLAVELGVVQLAVLARDAPARTAGIEAARAVLMAGFATGDPQVSACQRRLEALANLELAPPIPTLQASLTALAAARAAAAP